MQPTFRSLASAASLAILAAGCLDPGAIEDESRLSEEVRRAVHEQAYRGPGYLQVNTDPYPTGLNDTDRINVYVTVDAARALWQIDPDREGSGVALPPDSIIVREVIGTDDRVSKLTVMARGVDGYFPAGGDYCYAVTSADGHDWLDDADGAPLRGRLADCATCHTERAGDDFLFGVPQAHRRPLPTGL